VRAGHGERLGQQRREIRTGGVQLCCAPEIIDGGAELPQLHADHAGNAVDTRMIRSMRQQTFSDQLSVVPACLSVGIDKLRVELFWVDHWKKSGVETGDGNTPTNMPCRDSERIGDLLQLPSVTIGVESIVDNLLAYFVN
jgi:hypothetical protein